MLCTHLTQHPPPAKNPGKLPPHLSPPSSVQALPRVPSLSVVPSVLAQPAHIDAEMLTHASDSTIGKVLLFRLCGHMTKPGSHTFRKAAFCSALRSGIALVMNLFAAAMLRDSAGLCSFNHFSDSTFSTFLEYSRSRSCTSMPHNNLGTGAPEMSHDGEGGGELPPCP